MPEINTPGPDDMISRGEVFENTFGSKPPDEDGVFEDEHRNRAADKIHHLFGGIDLESLAADKQNHGDQDNVTDIF